MPAKSACRAHPLFNAQNELGDALAMATRTGLDVARACCHGQIVLGFAGAVRHEAAVAAPAGQFDRIQGLGDRADLIEPVLLRYVLTEQKRPVMFGHD
jgi:hypothetical protein